MLGINKDDSVKYFSDLDTDASRITIDINGYEGYALALIYTDGPAKKIISGNLGSDSLGNYYTVAQGDVLGRIAKNLDKTVAALAEKNNLSDVNKLRIGQKIYY